MFSFGQCEGENILIKKCRFLYFCGIPTLLVKLGEEAHFVQKNICFHLDNAWDKIFLYKSVDFCIVVESQLYF